MGFSLTGSPRFTGDGMGRITRVTARLFLTMAGFMLLIALFPGIIDFLPNLMRGNTTRIRGFRAADSSELSMIV